MRQNVTNCNKYRQHNVRKRGGQQTTAVTTAAVETVNN